MNEDHHWPQRRRHDIHARPQHHLGDVAGSGRAHDRLLQIVLGLAQLCLQAGDRRIDAADLGLVGQLRGRGGGLGLSEGLLGDVDIAGELVEGRFGDHVLLEQGELPLVVLLGEGELCLDLVDIGESLVVGALELFDVLLRLGKHRLLLIDHELILRRIDAEQDVALLERRVRLDRHLDHAASDIGENRRGGEVDPRVLAERVVVVHHQHDDADHEDAAEHRRRQRPFVDRNAEDLEDRDADRRIGEDQQEFHQPAPRLGPEGSSSIASAATGWRRGDARFSNLA